MHIPASMRARIPSAITDHLERSVTASNVGREDRLVRGCIALSLILLGGFTLVGARHLNLVTVAFLVLGGYFALTAALGSDPGYERAGIDTRTDAEMADGSDPAAPEVVDLTDAAADKPAAAYSPIPSLHR